MSRVLPRSKTIRVGKSATVKVTLVVDGDTFLGEIDGESHVFHLDCVDAPELEQPFGIDARDELSRLLESKTVQLGIERRSPLADLGWHVRVTLPDAAADDVARQLIAAGLLWGTCERYRSDVETARIREQGLWTQASPTAPWDFRQAGGHDQ